MTHVLHTLFFTLCLLLPTQAFAQERLAVLEFTGKLDQDVLQTLTDEARGGAQRILREAGEDYIVMSRENMNIILSDMGLGEECLAEGSCEVETARNLNAAYVVSGSALNIEGTYLVTIKLHNTASGALLGMEKAEGKSLLDTVHATAAVVEQLLIKGMNLKMTRGASPVRAGESAPMFTSSIDLDLDRKLKEKACAEEAERVGQQRRTAALEAEANRIQGMAAEAWRSLDGESAKCLDLDLTERAPCITAVESWLASAEGAEAHLQAGTDWVETECGQREQVQSDALKKVTIVELEQARERLAQLEQSSSETLLERALRLYRPHQPAQEAVKDVEEAAVLYAQACESGEMWGCVTLGDIYETGALEQDRLFLDTGYDPKIINEGAARAVELFQKACDGGLMAGCIRLASMYAHGEGVREDDVRAVELYRQACKQDRANCYGLGYMYYWGEGVSQNKSRARSLYRQACSGGNSQACERL